MSRNLLSSVVAASAVLPLTPAIANDACGVHSEGVPVVCVPDDNPYADGIVYDVTADIELHLEPGVSVERASGYNLDGVDVYGAGYSFTIDAAEGSRILVDGDATDGIVATGTRSITIRSSAEIVAGTAGLRGWINDAASADDVLVVQRENGSIRLTQDNGTAIQAATSGTGDATAESAGHIEIDRSGTDAIYALGSNPDGGAVTTRLHEGGTITSTGANSSALYSLGAGKGPITASAAGTISMVGDSSFGLVSFASSPTGEGETVVELLGTGSVSTSGDGSPALWAVQGGLGGVTATVSGTITTSGPDSQGLLVTAYNPASTAPVSVTVDGNGAITTDGALADAISVDSWGSGSTTIDLRGNANLQTLGDRARGVFALVSGPLSLTQSGSAMIMAQGAEGMGAYLTSDSSDVSVLLEGPVLATGEFGVASASVGGGSVEQQVVSTYLRGGWQADATGTGPTSLLPSIAVYLEGTISARLFNSGSIGAGSDRAVVASGGDVTIDNLGLIEGFVQLSGSGAIAFNNGTDATFNVRHLADTDGDGVRDTKRVAMSSFGGPASVFNNAPDGWVSIGDVSGAVTTDATGYYVPTTGTDLRPLAGYDFTLPDINQGQLLELGTFNHAGVIDLRGSVIGNSLVITGAASAGGAPGNGIFVSNGGRLLLNVELNEGLQPGGQGGSRADVLIVDGTQLGTLPTIIELDRKEGDGALTPGNGILLVEVRNKAQSAPGVFVLDADYTHNGLPSVILGAYAYSLFHHGTGDDAADGNWYLRSSVLDLGPTDPVDTPPPPPPSPSPSPSPADPENPPPPPDEPSGEVPPASPRFQPGVPLYETYAANLQALNALPTLQQRVGQRPWSVGPEGRTSGAWARASGSDTRARPAHSSSNTRHLVRTWGLQAGIDGVVQEDDDVKVVASLAFEYGRARSDVESAFGDGRIDTTGYGLGTMWTWYGRQGLYVDAQARISRYDSDLDSAVLGRIVRGHHGVGRAFSLEVGKAFALGTTWSLVPQTQLGYSAVRFDRFVDPGNAAVSTGNADSLISRVGIAVARDHDAGTRSSHLYVIGNFSYEWKDGLHTVVSGTRITREDRRQWGEIGLGASVNWSSGVRLYGEIAARSPLRDIGESHTVQGTAGVSWRF